MFAALADASQVAARAMGLAALVCRASMEDPTARAEARDMHRLVLRWVYDVGADRGLDPQELQILVAEPGELAPEGIALAAWRLEQLAVLVWALGKGPLPRINERHAPRWLAQRIGFLDADARARVREATLRPAGELLRYSVAIGDVFEHLRRELPASLDAETALALAVASERKAAIEWLLGERPLAAENRADA